MTEDVTHFKTGRQIFGTLSLCSVVARQCSCQCQMFDGEFKRSVVRGLVSPSCCVVSSIF